MVTLHTEKAFENAIEAHLLAHGYLKCDPATFDRARMLDSVPLFAFIAGTQGLVWDDLHAPREVGGDVSGWLGVIVSPGITR